LWEARTGRLLYRFSFDRAEVLSFSPAGRWLAAGGANGKVCLLRLAPE
jgi:hypothetical protein